MRDADPPVTPPRLLALWSAPRSRSTAFLRMMAERGDFTVVHEPFSQVVDFGVTAVGHTQVRDEAAVIVALRTLAARGPVFFKDTTDFRYPTLLADTAFLTEITHTFIIRHPAEAIASHAALNRNLGRDEVGFAWLAEIYDTVARVGSRPVVVDSDDLVDRPTETVRTYCQLVGIPFRPEALHWHPGLCEEWRRTHRWHESTSRTSGFVRPSRPGRPGTEAVRADPVLADYLDYHLPHYQRLHARRMLLPRHEPDAG